jgi:tetrahydromethanopterin S-methyltransferase subunit E
MEQLTSALAILSAMLTPAVLILACSSLTVATSSRLGRVIDRTRRLSERFEELASTDTGAVLMDERRAFLFDQLDKATARARLLQKAMTQLYLGLSAFLATSVAIGIDAAIRQDLGWIEVTLGMVGVGLLFYASVLLIRESRIALEAINDEMDFTRRLGEFLAPSQLLEDRSERSRRRGWRRRAQ